MPTAIGAYAGKGTFYFHPADLAVFNSTLRRLRTNVARPTMFLELVGQSLHKETMRSFEHERDPDTGRAWPKLALSTQYGRRGGKRKGQKVGRDVRHVFDMTRGKRTGRGVFKSGKRKGQEWVRSYKILQDTGKLRASYQIRKGLTPVPHVMCGTNLTGEKGCHYPEVHHYGSRDKTIPRRRQLPTAMTVRMRREIHAALVAQLRAGIVGRYLG